jgi:hypothetical protein
MAPRVNDRLITGSSTKATVAGCILGAGVLAWLVLTSFAPGFGAMLAIFGSPIIAWAIILRLLTLPTQRELRAGGKRSRPSDQGSSERAGLVDDWPRRSGCS